MVLDLLVGKDTTASVRDRIERAMAILENQNSKDRLGVGNGQSLLVLSGDLLGEGDDAPWKALTTASKSKWLSHLEALHQVELKETDLLCICDGRSVELRQATREFLAKQRRPFEDAPVFVRGSPGRVGRQEVVVIFWWW